MIYISIGSNRGNRLAFLQKAVVLLKERYLKNSTCSIILETESILPDGAPIEWDKPFLNMVVAGYCDLSPESLLKGLKQIEQEMGRPQIYERGSPRVIDLDILQWDDRVIETPFLKIPHPELVHRPFLLHLLKMMNPAAVDHLFHGESCFLQSFTLSPQFVGVVNITPDSFSDGGLYQDKAQAIAKAHQFSSEGASVVELGAQSTRPGAYIQTPEEEYLRLKPVLDGLHPSMEAEEIAVSIDTFYPEVIHKVLEKYPVAWINDVKGALDESTLKRIASHPCHLLTMHCLGIPPQKEIVLEADNPIDTLNVWAERTIDRLLGFGFREDAIIIDPGIGFGKSAYQNIYLLRQVEILKKRGCSVLVGHSRKSFMASFSKAEASDRDIETLALSEFLQHKVDFLRVHEVANHRRFFVAQAALHGGVS